MVTAMAGIVPVAKGAKMATNVVQEAAAPIRAYHGSPHSFDRFDISKIGTGEGVQSFGHGLYFAENEGVARDYRNTLAKGYATDSGPLPQQTQRALEYIDPKFSGDLKVGVEDAIARLQKQSEFYRKNYGEGPNLYDSAIERLRSVDPTTLKPAGHMYEVGIHADQAKMLDWDRPLSGQNIGNPDALNKLLASAPVRPTSGISQGPFTVAELTEYGATGRDLYDRLSWAAGKKGAFPEINVAQPVGATSAFREAGIPGIKYLDQGSRTAGQGSSNYVVFDPSIIEIMRKYGLLPATVAAGVGGAAALPSNDIPPGGLF
jgi:hypothetical protein